MAQDDPIYVPSEHSESGRVAKCVIRLKQLGGDYEDEVIAWMYGNLALCRFAVGDVVLATLRFKTHEKNGTHYQFIIATDIVKFHNY